MEGDRAAALTLQSAVTGVIDYSKADIRSPSWWRTWRLLINGMEQQNRGKLLHNAYEFQLALVSNNRISADDFSKSQRTAKELFEDMDAVYRPWVGITAERRLKSESDAFKEQWEQLAGFKLSDAEARKNWESQIKQVIKDKADAAQEEARKERERVANFEKVRQEVIRKRLSQQGRR